MVAAHLLEDRERFLLKALGNCSLEQCSHLVCSRFYARRQPKRHPREAVDAIGGAVLECLSPEPHDQIGEVLEILEWIRTRPTRNGICAKRQYNDSDSALLFRCGRRLDPFRRQSLPPETDWVRSPS